MTVIDPHDALCCLISSIEQSATDAGADPFTHGYPSASLTPPYCDHDAIVARNLGASTEPPPALADLGPAEDIRADGVKWWHRFEAIVVRCGPPWPDTDGCLGDLYGDCTSPADHQTLAGHERALMAEAERLRSELLAYWCDCLVDATPGPGPRYRRSARRWFDDITLESGEGRFSFIRIRVGTDLG